VRYFIHLRYLGKNYHGWQRQTNAHSVQAELEDAMSLLLREKINCHGCGRTDTRVHASQYIAHFDIGIKWEIDLVYRLNQLLPDDIVVYEIKEVEPKLNAQLDVISRTYQYYVHFERSPFLADVSTYYEWNGLDLSLVSKVLGSLVGQHDFASFCLKSDQHRSTICEVKNVLLGKHDHAPQIYLQITADHFLRGMVRHLVYTVLKIGWHTLTLQEFKNALDNQQPLPFRKMAYPQGLHLSRVTYPTLDFHPRSIHLGRGDLSWAIKC